MRYLAAGIPFTACLYLLGHIVVAAQRLAHP